MPNLNSISNPLIPFQDKLEILFPIFYITIIIELSKIGIQFIMQSLPIIVISILPSSSPSLLPPNIPIK